MEYVRLALCPRNLTAYRLVDGRLLRDRSGADADPVQRAARALAIDKALAALLGLPVEVPPGRRTPARAQCVRNLIADGVLPASIGSQLLDGRIDDTTWATLQRLVTAGKPEVLTVECWDLTLSSVQDDPLVLPILYDPLEHRGDTPPLAAFGHALRALTTQGWMVQRSYPIDSSETDNEVTGIACLLARPARLAVSRAERALRRTAVV